MNGFHLLSVQFLPADFGKQQKMGILSGFLRADHRYAPISNSSDRRVEILFVQACPPNRPDGADRGHFCRFGDTIPPAVITCQNTG